MSQNQPVIAKAVDEPIQPTVVHATAAQPADNIGICRRCRRQFVRRPGVNDGQAQYYRCDDCEQYRFQDMVFGSCTIS